MNKVIEALLHQQVVASVVTLVAAVVAWFLIKHVIDRFWGPENDTVREQHRVRTLHTVARTVLIVVTVLTVLQINNINVTSMVASLGLVSAIAGLALQDYFKDIIMSIRMKSDHFFEVGDVVKYGSIEGVVTEFTSKCLKIESIYDHSVTTICNRNISELTVVGHQLDINVPLSYGDNSAKVREVLSAVCDKLKEREDVEDALFVGTKEFADSSINYTVRLFCPPPRRVIVYRAAMAEIQSAVEASGLEIPFMQVDVHNK